MVIAMDPSRADVRDHLERLRRGHAILRDLRLRQLRELSEADSRAQYDRLVRTWQAQAGDRDPALDRRAIEQRVALRRRLAGRR
jgi:hypothetical protein